MKNKCWLFKSEPEVFSIDDLQKEKKSTTYWDGVRNYQARNFLRDEIKKGDLVLFYHSNSDPNVVAGYCRVVKEGYPDQSQFDPEDEHFFPSADPDNPVWYMVDIQLIKKFSNPVSLQAIKANPKLKTMRLIQKGNRLSVMPVTLDEFNEIVKMGK